ncbi:ATP-binding protein [Pollutimonas bauzanensis]|uniref:AAA ATPase domain-containing protein n=1 Tax=Pollutimonas bauzanensis TaxID=658167 RepID=A0A1M5ZFE2_9BURK|nr:ATP-binding protein [Pollutimonas bauzanensis]SHI22958.1 AAA ATPase domain-containing protein [Pollutimonas bauzanensis]
MDPRDNPFVPGAGTPPPELAGRHDVLERAEIALTRIQRGRPSKSLIVVGLRGVGKTVLLVRFQDQAERQGYQATLIEAHEGKSLPELLIPPLRKMLYSLSVTAAAGEKGRKALRALRSFIGTVKVSYGDFELGIEPEKGVADSGDLEVDLGDLFVAVGEAAAERATAVALCIDEMQYLSSKEFSALIMAVHKVSQRNLPLVIVGAGLPQILGLAGQSKSYAERLFDYPSVGALSSEDAKAALVAPAAATGVEFASAALDKIVSLTKGYPYFLQQWGYEVWNIAAESPISLLDVEVATNAAIRALDESFFRVRFDRCTPSEKRYMRALAQLGEGSKRSGDVAEALNVKVTSIGPTRSKLILKGMIYSPQHGETAFTVPLFDEYMRRVMPGEDWRHV